MNRAARTVLSMVLTVAIGAVWALILADGPTLFYHLLALGFRDITLEGIAATHWRLIALAVALMGLDAAWPSRSRPLARRILGYILATALLASFQGAFEKDLTPPAFRPADSLLGIPLSAIRAAVFIVPLAFLVSRLARR